MLWSTAALAQAPYGIEERVANEAFRVSTRGEGLQDMQLRRVFAERALRQPVFLTHAGDGSGRLFALERAGLVQVFGVDAQGRISSAQFFLVIRDRVNSSAQESGLLGLAFHPDYANNGRFYVYYTYGAFASRISEFRVSVDANWADASSERVLLQIEQEHDGHFGGQLAFGPDGMLYIGLGDNGTAANGQDLRTLQGAVLRIDVDQRQLGLPYAIPHDNPLVGNSSSWREEIWAWGFRNPWRFSFDRESGQLWLGDVGGSRREEINQVQRGGNYGWSLWEGTECGPANDACDARDFVAPVLDYGRDQGQSVIGGYVYWGTRLPRLRGAYIYGDFVSRSVWALRYEAGQVVEHQLLARSPSPLTSFGLDEAGELYAVGLDGALYVLEESTDEGVEQIPQTLVESGLFADVQRQRPSPGILAYSVNAELWSDGTHKTRLLALPGTTQMGFVSEGNWRFPSDAVLVKNFYIERVVGDVQSRQIVETRFLVKDRRGAGWSGFSYMWNEEGSDAELLAGSAERVFAVVDAQGQRRAQVHQYPSRAQCRACHTAAAGYVLGVNTAQMNREHRYGEVEDNQLRALNHAGYFARDIGEEYAAFPRLPAPQDQSIAVAPRARAYLDANCSHCHRPGGPVRTAFDLRYETPLEQMGVLNVSAKLGDLGRDELALVQPGWPQRSALYLRMLDLGAARMPPLATTVVDAQGSAWVGEWIAALALPTLVAENGSTPLDFALLANYPNPFNATTTIVYRLHIAAELELEIYNLRGQRVRLLKRGYQRAGGHQVEWDGRGDDGGEVAMGVYFYRLRAEGAQQVRKMVLVK